MKPLSSSMCTFASTAVAGVWLCLGAPAHANDLLNDVNPYSGAVLHLKTVVDINDSRLISMTARPDNSLLYVSSQHGQVFEVDAAGNKTTWFDYDTLVSAAVANASDGYVLDLTNGGHGGLRAVAFHPEFATNGKFYTSAMVDSPSNPTGINYLGTSSGTIPAESAVVEWTYDHQAQQVDTSSYRELFRVKMPKYDHPVKQIAFNPFAQPSDEDYGLLYIAHGDGSVQSATAGGGLVTDDALGKVLRVNPLQNGGSPYTTPGNPFNSTPGTLDEIYTLGHRNPHHLSFAQDALGETHVIVAEAGRDNIEEINILQPGGSYGWSDREGTFVHLPSGGYINGVQDLPADEWQRNDYIYPAVQYDHNAKTGAGYVGSAVAGGFVLDHPNYAGLDGQYIFADFGTKSGFVYQADWQQMLGAHTQLADGETPDMLTQAPIQHVLLTLDTDGDGTPDRYSDNLNALFKKFRNDVRFGRAADGTMYLTSKRTGELYVVTGVSNTFNDSAPSPLRLIDTFSYSDGGLAGKNGGSGGWVGGWLGGHDVVDGKVESERNKLVSREFVGHTPNQTIYFSMQVMATTDDNNEYAAWLQIDDNAYNDNGDGVQIGLADGKFSMRIENAGKNGDFGIYTHGQAVRIVGKLVFNHDGTKEQLTAWVNPTGYEAGEATNTISADADFSLAQSVELREWVFGGDKVLFDDVRLGTTWADVVSTLFLPGDIDGDDDVDGVDLGYFFNAFTGPNAGPPSIAGTDLDGDGDVDGVDLGVLFAGFTGPLAPANVPEPGTLALLAFAGVALIGRRRR